MTITMAVVCTSCPPRVRPAELGVTKRDYHHSKRTFSRIVGLVVTPWKAPVGSHLLHAALSAESRISLMEPERSEVLGTDGITALRGCIGDGLNACLRLSCSAAACTWRRADGKAAPEDASSIAICYEAQFCEHNCANAVSLGLSRAGK